MFSRCLGLLLLQGLLPLDAYWDGGRDTPDPMTAAMMMSKRAQHDPDALRKDPDMFKRMFGQLAVEQQQAKSMDEHQSTATPKDVCMACHGVVNEFEKMMVERKTMATGGLGGRNQLAVADAFEKICHLNRYEFQDPVNLKERREESRRYGGLAPVIFANACKWVIDKWSDYDEVESALVKGGKPANMHEELRAELCLNEEWGSCDGVSAQVEVRTGEEGWTGEVLRWKGEEESCSAEGGKKKKKKKKRAVDPVTGEEYKVSMS